MTEDAGMEKAKSDALRLLSFRPRSVAELRQRLKLKKYPESIIAPVIELLQKQHLLDDEKFAKLFANSRVNSRPAGKRQIELDLKKKGLPGDLIRRTMESLTDYDEKKTARDLVRRKKQKMSGVSDEKKKARLFGFLQRRGFSSGVIFSVLSELFAEAAADESEMDFR